MSDLARPTLEVRHDADAARASAEDRALVTQLLAGDEAAFAGLVTAYHGRLLRLARGFVASQASAEEVVQDTWLALMNGLDKFEGRSSLKSWIFRILVNRAKTRGVREARSTPMSTDADGGPAVDPARFEPGGGWARPPRSWDTHTPERLASDAEAMARLETSLAALPPQQRAVVTLRDVEGLDALEVCNALDITETNQRVLLHRARAKLREALEEYVEQR